MVITVATFLIALAIGGFFSHLNPLGLSKMAGW